MSDHIFLRPSYTLHYRRGANTPWVSEARAEYAGLLLLSGQAGPLTDSGALLFNPHENALVTLSQADYLGFTLTPAFMLDCAVRAGFTGRYGLITLRLRTVPQDERLARLARDLAEEMTQAATGQEAFLAALVEQLTLHLLRHYANLRRAPDVELSRVGLVDRRIRRAVELMHARLAEDLTLEEMAAAAYLSPFHFARLFKKLTGATPHAYLSGLRLARAQNLLAETDFSVTEIALQVGYDSPSHFTKAFRQAAGLTPREFRAALVR